MIRAKNGHWERPWLVFGIHVWIKLRWEFLSSKLRHCWWYLVDLLSRSERESVSWLKDIIMKDTHQIDIITYDSCAARIYTQGHQQAPAEKRRRFRIEKIKASKNDFGPIEYHVDPGTSEKRTKNRFISGCEQYQMEHTQELVQTSFMDERKEERMRKGWDGNIYRILCTLNVERIEIIEMLEE